MLALILAAGVGERLGDDGLHPPKALLRFGGDTLLARHIAILRHFGIDQLVVATGYRAELIEAELSAIGANGFARTVLNPDYRAGSILSLWSLRSWLSCGADVLVMDADVLYDQRLMRRLVESAHENCFLIDREFEAGDEPVKLGMRDGVVVELARKLEGDYDVVGESVGFVRLSSAMARHLMDAMAKRLARGEGGLWHEAAVRDLLVAPLPEKFRYEDVTGLPWIEIDFPEDVVRAERRVLRRLEALPAVLTGVSR